MAEFWTWITDLGNSKIAALVIFFTTFVGIILYIYSSKNRGQRLESYKYIPFADDQDEAEKRSNEADEK